MSAGERKMSCSEVGPLLVFLACDELTTEERTSIETHLESCADCRALLAEENAFQECLGMIPQTADELDRSGTLLAQCRSELAESLDEMAVPVEPERWRPFGFVRRWMALRPGWSAAGLLTAGAILGVQLLQWLPTDNSNFKGKAVTVSAAPRVSDDQLAKMAVSGINFAPGTDEAPGTLQVQLRAEQPLVLSGSIDDADMRRVLTYVVRNSERFDAGVRLDCLDALKSRIYDGEIRSALLNAVGHDQNPAVRMKALEALREVAGDEDVRDALLESLNRDANSGVRVEAVNLLVRSLELESTAKMTVAGGPPEPPESDMPMVARNAPAVALPGAEPSVQRVVRALEDLQRHDPNRYVRLRSAAALRQIGPPDVQ
jgi:anti-sigma factor RsiW